MDRRQFLKLAGLIIIGEGALQGCGGSNNPTFNPDSPPTTPSYQSSELLKMFETMEPLYRAAMQPTIDRAEIEEVTARALQDFNALAMLIPYIGPMTYPLSSTLVASAVALSFGRTFRSIGLSIEDAGKIIVNAFKEGMSAYSSDELRAQGDYFFTEANYQQYKRGAIESQKKRYPGDWVYEFREGPGDLECEIDFSECAILKFYAAQGMVDLVLYQCVQDFIVSDLQGTGLTRQGTLAGGADCCDFRYKKGRIVSDGLACFGDFAR